MNSRLVVAALVAFANCTSAAHFAIVSCLSITARQRERNANASMAQISSAAMHDPTIKNASPTAEEHVDPE